MTAIVTCKTCRDQWLIASVSEAGPSLRAHYEHEHGGPYRADASEPLLSQAWGSPGGTASRLPRGVHPQAPSSPRRGFWQRVAAWWLDERTWPKAGGPK